MNRARPMAARLKKNNKPRVNLEPRSAHGRAVNEQKAEMIAADFEHNTKRICNRKKYKFIQWCTHYLSPLIPS